MSERADLSVYLVTDREQCAASGRSVVETVRAAVAGGVRTVQIRDKDAAAADFLADVTAVARELPDDVALVVNDRVDVFLAARQLGARVDGVHVGQSDLPVGPVRRMIGPDALIGLSAATEQELYAAAADPAGVDYVGIGPLHPTGTKRNAPPALGLERWRELAAGTRLPAVAIGGITGADLAPLRAAGAAGAAVVSAICRADDPQAAAAELAAAWSS